MVKDFNERLEAAQQEQTEYLKSEEYKREVWEKDQDRWEAKARREGWHYTRRPFVGALERQQQADQARLREIAELKERLAKLESVS